MGKSNQTSIVQIARENGETDNALPLDLGLRVRELRKARSWTLEPVSYTHLRAHET